MSYQVVSLSDEEVGTLPLHQAFDAKLAPFLHNQQRVVPIHLRPEDDECATDLEWLARWSQTFAGAGKTFVVLPQTPLQVECLDLSHPDQNLRYVLNLDELERQYPELMIEDVVVPPPPPAHEAPLPVVAGGAPDTHRTEQVVEPYAIELDKLAMVPETLVGDTSQISGEYTCIGCGSRRMWLKGDLVTACTDAECLNPESGWRLSCDLF